jgi:hypothetical protein
MEDPANLAPACLKQHSQIAVRFGMGSDLLDGQLEVGIVQIGFVVGHGAA